MRFWTLKQLADLCTSEGLTIAEVMLADQSHESGKPPEYVFDKMRAYYQIMKEAVTKGLTEDTTSRSGLTGKDAQRWARQCREKHRETAKGGLAQTPTGRKIMKELNFNK